MNHYNDGFDFVEKYIFFSFLLEIYKIIKRNYGTMNSVFKLIHIFTFYI